MHQLKVEHNKKDRRPGKGRCIALSRRIYRLQNTDVFYVESESSDNIYYFVKYQPNALEWWYSCRDNSTRHKKCKHIYSLEFAIRMGTLKETDKLPADAKRVTSSVLVSPSQIAITEEEETKSYTKDDYSF